MFGIGGFELFIILVFGFLIFGPDKLPEVAKTVGKGIARFREAQQEMNETIGNEKIFDPNNPDQPFKDPVEVLDKLAQKHEEKQSARSSASEGGKATRFSNATASAEAKADSAGPGQAKSEGGRQPDAPGVPNEDGGTEPSDGADSASVTASPRKQESFTERKARYERERAARKAAEANQGNAGQVEAVSDQGAAEQRGRLEKRAEGASQPAQSTQSASGDQARPEAQPASGELPSAQGGDA